MAVRELRRPSGQSSGLLHKIRRIDWFLVSLLVILSAFGFVALIAAGNGSADRYAVPQLIHYLIGFTLMFIIALTDIRTIKKYAWPAYGLGIILLLAVLKIGVIINGSARWLDFAHLSIQPSEYMKIALILALSSWFCEAADEQVRNIFFLIPPALAILAPAVLIYKEPNLGTCLIVLMIGVVMFWGAGVKWWKFVAVAALITGLAPLVYHHLHAYQKERIYIFLHPGSQALGAGYNIMQSKIALGAGGLHGQGFLRGTQGQLGFLPEKETDFIFALFGEEFGYIGGMILMGLLALITFWTSFRAITCQHRFGRLFGIGMAANFFLYIFINLAMVMGAIPVGGIPLPLVSYGGTATIVILMGFGVVLSAKIHDDAVFSPF